MMRCKNCGQEIPKEAEFCPECGQRVERGRQCALCGHPLEEEGAFCPVCGALNQQEKRCAVCGSPLQEDAVFCANCGYPAAVRPQDEREKEADFLSSSVSTPRAGNKNGLLPILLVLAAGIVAAAGLLGAKYLLTQKEEKKVQTENRQEQQAKSNEVQSEAIETEKPAKSENPTPTETNIPTDTPQALPTKPPHADVITNFSAVASLADTYTRIGEAQVISATASSQIYQESGVQNPPIFLFDGDDQTNWQEGVPGDGIGESVSFTFDQEYQVEALSLRLGNWKSNQYFMGNNRPKTLEITMGNQAWELTFPDEWQEFGVAFSAPIVTKDLTIKILEVYKGNDWEDTPITEVSVWRE